MKEQEEDDDLINNLQFKPPDRSTSAPPVLSLNSNSLFAFRANEIFSDIRTDEKYFEFYISHCNQEKLPPPLEIQTSFYNAPEQEWLPSRNAFFQEYFKNSPQIFPGYQQNQPPTGFVGQQGHQQ